MTCAFLWERRPRRDEQTETMKMDSAPMFPLVPKLQLGNTTVQKLQLRFP
jgi:hypothetical protein